MSVDIPDAASSGGSEESGGHKLVDLFQSFLEPEELDADNKWSCSKCSENVQAMKSASLESAPRKLVVQLKRFRFDPSSRRRRKLNNAVLFPLAITAQELVNSNNAAASLQECDVGAVYDLTGVIVHTGTAQGGHYRAYCRDMAVAGANTWVDFNDTVVTVLDDVERDALFWYNGAPGASESATRRDLVYKNAYMLHYTRRTDAVPPAVAVPADLAVEVAAENAEFRELQKAYEVMKSVVSVNAHAVDSNGRELGSSVAIDLNVSSTLAEATRTVAAALVERGAGTVPDHSTNPSMWRLRRYNSASKWMTDTFTDKTDCSLSELGFEGGNSEGNRNTLALEIKCDESVTFSAFNPNEMRVRCFNWTDLVSSGYGISDAESDASNYAFPIDVVPTVHVVPGDDQASVGALRDLLATQHGVATSLIKIIRCTNKRVLNVDDDSKTARSYNIAPDDDVVVEIMAGPEATSAAMEKLSQLCRNITLQFNNPFAAATDADADAGSAYVHSIKTPLDSSLLDVKQLICGKLNECNGDSAKVEPEGFHLRRNNTGAPQLKDETKTLEDLEFVNFSVIHVQVCGASEVIFYYPFIYQFLCLLIGWQRVQGWRIPPPI